MVGAAELHGGGVRTPRARIQCVNTACSTSFVDRSNVRLVSSGGIPMNADQTKPSGSDLTKGIEVELLADGAILLGHVGQDQVILARSGDEVFAVDATCTH